MYQDTACDDRRLFKRYSMEAPVLITGDSLVGLIRDLSCGGCSFRYVKKKYEIESLPGTEYSLCLDPLGMAKVRVQTVEDLPEYGTVDNLAGTMHLRRVKFADLNLLQMRSLQQYLRKNCKAVDESSLELPAAGLLRPKSAKANLLSIGPSPGC